MHTATGSIIEGPLFYYAVLFLDLLGQRDTIRHLENLNPLQDNEEDYRRQFGEAAGKIWGVRNALEEGISRRISGSPANEGTRSAPTVRIQSFSDSIMAYFPFDRQNPNTLLALNALVCAAGETMLAALASEVPIRGGLDVHIATEFNQQSAPQQSSRAGETHPPAIELGGDIWGPAPTLAYELAEKGAGYPRILVGEGIPEFVKHTLKAAAQRVTAEPASAVSLQPAISAAKSMTGLIAQDPNDEQLILDYLAPGMRDVLPAEIVNLVPKAVTFANEDLQRFRNSKNEKLADRYAKLVKYINARREPNGIVPSATG